MHLHDAITLLRDDPTAISVEERQRLLASVTSELVSHNQTDPVATELVERLATDPDWSVRLDVARMVHQLDHEVRLRCLAILQRDSNGYVREHARRSLDRQRKSRRSSERRRSQSRASANELERLRRQHGKDVAATVQSLAEQRLADLTAALAHDQRATLTTLTANLAALADDRRDCPLVRSMQEDVRFLERRVDAMQRFTEPLPVERHPEDVTEMIQQATEAARQAVVDQGHDPAAVVVEVDSLQSLRLTVSRPLIVMALTNVIENAFETFALPDRDALRPGRIDIDVQVDGYDTRIVVRDDGPGIEKPVLKQLATFVPCGPNKSKRASTGWGLCLVNRYVTAHHGVVEIASKLDAGTTVTITLPRQEAAEEQAA